MTTGVRPVNAFALVDIDLAHVDDARRRVLLPLLIRRAPARFAPPHQRGAHQHQPLHLLQQRPHNRNANLGAPCSVAWPQVWAWHGWRTRWAWAKPLVKC